jgi:hypothetical protein
MIVIIDAARKSITFYYTILCRNKVIAFGGERKNYTRSSKLIFFSAVPLFSFRISVKKSMKIVIGQKIKAAISTRGDNLVILNNL